MVEKVATTVKFLGTTHTMMDAATVADAAIGPRTAGSLGEMGTRLT